MTYHMDVTTLENLDILSGLLPHSENSQNS